MVIGDNRSIDRGHRAHYNFEAHKFRWFDFDSDCMMSIEEFRDAYRALKASVGKEGEQRQWHSYSIKHADWLRHKRLPYEP
jgi:hypothetical protein